LLVAVAAVQVMALHSLVVVVVLAVTAIAFLVKRLVVAEQPKHR
jgi:hypothetical protein